MLCAPAVGNDSMTQESTTMIAAFVLIAALCMQSAVVFSQQSHQLSSGYQGQMWTPQSWATPYYGAASNSWMDYLKQAQEISNQFLKQWDKTGASNMVAMGFDYAKQAAKQFEKVPGSVAQTAQETAAKVPFF